MNAFIRNSVLAAFPAALALFLLSCISDYKDDYKLRKVEAFTPTPTESTVAACADKVDNDGNGLVDCDDPGCGGFQECRIINNADNAENTLARCSDGVDNDGNGLTDCDDPRCLAFQKCVPPLKPMENTVALCSDKIDNDGNGKIDCADPECQALKLCGATVSVENTAALCSDKIDNNGNGLIDCADPDCQALKQCGSVVAENTLALCTDKIDNDGNGKIDCADTSGCGALTVCQHPVENTPALCQDGKDNDGDGLTDCKDSDCENFTVCHPTENTALLCKDGIDNNGDGLIDCKDPGCKDLFICSVPDQDTVLILGYKTQGKLTPSIDASKPPMNLTWYYNGGDAGALTDDLGVKGISVGHNEEVTTCNVEPKCRKFTFGTTWGIAFQVFFKNSGAQDTVNLSGWIGSALKFSIKSQIVDIRIKLESKHLADATEIPLTDVGYDPTKTGWQNIVIPLLTWTSSQKLEFNRLPFSITKPEGSAGGTVLLENIRLEKEGVQ